MTTDHDVLVDQANQALTTRGFSPEEASVTSLGDGDTAEALLHGTLVEEARAPKGKLLLAVSSLPSRDELVAMRQTLDLPPSG